jgi:cob(I)alamin adenosyltransferase
LAQKIKKGLVQVFTGNGKGKTTAAIGTIVRAAGHGFKVCLISFMKGAYAYGEYKTLAKLPDIMIKQYGLRKFIDPAKINPEEKEQAKAALTAARKAVTSGDFDLVVLDEVNIAVCYNLIGLEDIISLIEDKLPSVDIILTGRYADPKILALADLVTEMVKVKHPFDNGVKARKGIEY